jgi:hypothetical protein
MLKQEEEGSTTILLFGCTFFYIKQLKTRAKVSHVVLQSTGITKGTVPLEHGIFFVIYSWNLL